MKICILELLIIEPEIKQIHVEPGEMLALHVGSPKDTLCSLLVELHQIPNDRFHQKYPKPPDIVLTDLPMDSIESIRGISKIISGNVSTHSKIHGHTTEMQIRSQPAPPNVVYGQRPEQLQDVKFIDRRVIDEITRRIVPVS